jgi:hypothetical protein
MQILLEAIFPSETSVEFQPDARRYVKENRALHDHGRDTSTPTMNLI